MLAAVQTLAALLKVKWHVLDCYLKTYLWVAIRERISKVGQLTKSRSA